MFQPASTSLGQGLEWGLACLNASLPQEQRVGGGGSGLAAGRGGIPDRDEVARLEQAQGSR